MKDTGTFFEQASLALKKADGNLGAVSRLLGDVLAAESLDNKQRWNAVDISRQLAYAAKEQLDALGKILQNQKDETNKHVTGPAVGGKREPCLRLISRGQDKGQTSPAAIDPWTPELRAFLEREREAAGPDAPGYAPETRTVHAALQSICPTGGNTVRNSIVTKIYFRKRNRCIG